MPSLTIISSQQNNFRTENVEVSSPRILIVEDEIKLLEHLVKSLGDVHFSTYTCGSIRELLNIIELPVKRFDLIILDRLLNGQDSATLIPKLKEQIPEAHILILSAIGTASEKASLLDLGADDYLSKPFDGTELVARIRALMRRKKKHFVFSNVMVDSENRMIKVDELEVPLTNKEFVLLRTLLQPPGKIFNKSFLYERVWEMSSEVDSNVVEATVNKLRKKLKESGARLNIKNTRNLGYWIEE